MSESTQDSQRRGDGGDRHRHDDTSGSPPRHSSRDDSTRSGGREQQDVQDRQSNRDGSHRDRDRERSSDQHHHRSHRERDRESSGADGRGEARERQQDGRQRDGGRDAESGRAERRDRRHDSDDDGGDGSADRRDHKRHKRSRERDRDSKKQSRDERKRQKKEKKEDRKRSRQDSGIEARIEQTKRLIAQVDAAPSSSTLPSVLTAADYFARSAEFRLWLHSTRGLHIDEIAAERARELFDSFIAAWNDCQLEAKYYAGIDSSALPSAVLTRHKWGFTSKMTEDEKMAAASTRDSVDTATYHHSYWQEFSDADKQTRASSSSAAVSSPLPAPPPPASSTSSSSSVRLDRRRHRREVETVLEELVPKETGREAILERRRQRGEYSRGDGGESMAEVLDDDALMGSSVSGAGELQRLLEREKRRDDRRQSELSSGREQYQQLEKQRMKAMLASIGQADKYPIN